MTRISEISDTEKNKNPLKLDKDSSARIIKRSLWQNAAKKGKQEICSTAAEYDGKPKEAPKRKTDSEEIEPSNKKRSM